MEKPKRKSLSLEETFAYLTSLPEAEADLLRRYFTKDIEFLTQMQYAQSKILGKHLVALGYMDPPIEQTDEERIAMWAKYGLPVSVPKGRCPFSDSMMLAEHDGVPYCVDEHTHLLKDGSDKDIHRNIGHRQMLIDCYHEKIKSVYEHCVRLDRGPVWVMVGGGSQVQAFFGHDQGYFAILFLDDCNLPRDTQAQREKLAKKCHTLQPQGELNEQLLGGMKLPGVKVEYFGQAPSPMD